MSLVKICKKPFIVENTDKWGAGLGTYYVNNCVGFVDDTLWHDLYDFEHYHLSEAGMAETAQVKLDVANGKDVATLDIPVMKRLIDKAQSQIWQFNMRTDDDILSMNVEYVRSIAVFGDVTLRVWDESHDTEVATLQAQVDVLNQGNKP